MVCSVLAVLGRMLGGHTNCYIWINIETWFDIILYLSNSFLSLFPPPPLPPVCVCVSSYRLLDCGCVDMWVGIIPGTTILSFTLIIISFLFFLPHPHPLLSPPSLSLSSLPPCLSLSPSLSLFLSWQKQTFINSDDASKSDWTFFSLSTFYRTNDISTHVSFVYWKGVCF